MYHFKFLQKSKTYVPSYQFDFFNFGFKSFLFAFCLELYLIFKGRYEKIYASAYKKELEKIRERDNRITDTKRRKMLLSQKLQEIDILEKKLLDKKQEAKINN